MKYWILYVFVLFVIAVVAIKKTGELPKLDVTSGQVISPSTATVRVETGYRMTFETSQRYSPQPAESPRPAKPSGASLCGENPPKEPRRPPAPVDSRTLVEQKRPEKTSPSDELLNPYIIENLVKSSDKTYYFTEKSLTRSGVTVELLSMTPRKDDYFLKFRITNAGNVHFIPQAFAVKHGDDWVDLEKFFKHILQAGESQVGYLRVKASASVGAGKDKMFQLNEAGGGFRKYSIFY